MFEWMSRSTAQEETVCVSAKVDLQQRDGATDVCLGWVPYRHDRLSGGVVNAAATMTIERKKEGDYIIRDGDGDGYLLPLCLLLRI